MRLVRGAAAPNNYPLAVSKKWQNKRKITFLWQNKKFGEKETSKLMVVMWLLVFLGCTLVLGGGLNPTVCNFEAPHGFLVAPLAASVEQCGVEGTPFFLSHGATFFCPHTYDVKLIGFFNNDANSLAAQITLCKAYFASKKDPNASIKYVLLPTLPINGLPSKNATSPFFLHFFFLFSDSGNGQLTSWVSPVLDKVHNFGDSNQSGPGNGWNTTTIFSKNITMNLKPIYFREFGLGQPKPKDLTYLLYNVSGQLLLTHYIVSAPSFDDIIFVDGQTGIVPGNVGAHPYIIRVPNVLDSVTNKLTPYSMVDVMVEGQDKNLEHVEGSAQLKIGRRLYSGVDDGFADFGVNCPFPPPYPQHPSLCANFL